MKKALLSKRPHGSRISALGIQNSRVNSQQSGSVLISGSGSSPFVITTPCCTSLMISDKSNIRTDYWPADWPLTTDQRAVSQWVTSDQQPVTSQEWKVARAKCQNWLELDARRICSSQEVKPTVIYVPLSTSLSSSYPVSLTSFNHSPLTMHNQVKISKASQIWLDP